jgi:hypothetical protein
MRGMVATTTSTSLVVRKIAESMPNHSRRISTDGNTSG